MSAASTQEIAELDRQRLRLEQRLKDGWNRINEADKAGKDIDSWTVFWLSLLHEYESICDAMLREA